MAVGKDRLIFDVTSVSDSDNVGAFLRTTSGIISSQLIDGKQNLHVHPTTAKQEDTPHVSGAFGDLLLGVRNDSNTTLAGIGDYIPLSTDHAGALRTTASGVSFKPHSIFFGGFRSIPNAALAQPLVSGTRKSVCVLVQAFSTNASRVRVGASGMIFHELFAADSVVIGIDDLSKIFVKADTNGDAVSFLALA